MTLTTHKRTEKLYISLVVSQKGASRHNAPFLTLLAGTLNPQIPCIATALAPSSGATAASIHRGGVGTGAGTDAAAASSSRAA